MENPVRVDGELVTVNPALMEQNKTYPFIYKGNGYLVWKNKKGHVNIIEVNV